MRILNVKFNASTRNFLSLVIPSAVFKVSVLGFWHVFLLEKQYRPLFIYLFILIIHFIYLFIYLLFVPSNSLRSILWKLYLTQFPSCFLCGEFPRLGLPLPAQLTLHSPCAALTAALLRIVIFTLKRMNATVKAVKTCRFVWKFQNCLSLRV